MELFGRPECSRPWPLRGAASVRQQPGPEAMEVDAQPPRVFCPVPARPSSAGATSKVHPLFASNVHLGLASKVHLGACVNWRPSRCFRRTAALARGVSSSILFGMDNPLVILGGWRRWRVERLQNYLRSRRPSRGFRLVAALASAAS